MTALLGQPIDWRSMARYHRTLARVLAGTADASIRFDDLRLVLLRLGFKERVRGSHHIYTHPIVAELLIVTRSGGQVKPYQVRGVRHILQTYGLAESQDE